MSEQLRESRTIEFINEHIRVMDDHNAYVEAAVRQWIADPNRAAGVWLRSNGDDYNEFAAHINYMRPTHEGLMCLGAIDIQADGGDTEIQVWFPASDGSGDPIVASREAYGDDALERAIELVEQYTS
jgi:hypothetical protein